MVGIEPEEKYFLQAVREGVTGRGSAGGAPRWRRRGSSWSTPILSSTIPPRSSATCNSAKSVGSKRVGLSRSEQLVELIRWRLTNKEIASRPNLSEHTVRNTFTAFYAKQGHPIEL